MKPPDLHQAVREVADGTVATGVQPAHGPQFWEFLQHEIQVPRRTTVSSLPNDILSTEYLSLEHEMIEPLWMAVLIPRFRRLSDRNFNRYRELLQTHSA